MISIILVESVDDLQKQTFTLRCTSNTSDQHYIFDIEFSTVSMTSISIGGKCNMFMIILFINDHHVMFV